jgi:hypothetical protein
MLLPPTCMLHDNACSIFYMLTDICNMQNLQHAKKLACSECNMLKNHMSTCKKTHVNMQHLFLMGQRLSGEDLPSVHEL